MTRGSIALLATLALCVPGPRAATAYAIAHDFAGGEHDGAGPQGDLIPLGDALYGVSQKGGGHDAGVVFSLRNGGRDLTVIHAFDPGDKHGALPTGRLVSDGMTLYGMTMGGGAYNDGTIFALRTDGSGYTLLHEFGGATVRDDGRLPEGSLVLRDGTLYGTTRKGGSHDLGTVFKISTAGTGYALLHQFAGAPDDGSEPRGDLLLDGTTLYGMTNTLFDPAPAIIFSLGTDGSGFKVLHVFLDTAGDRERPARGLIISGGRLYGMAEFGGEYDVGMIFSLLPDGTGFTRIYSFRGIFDGGTDGMMPKGSLISDGSTLYGMTRNGGEYGFGLYGYGTVFSVTAGGAAYTVLHHFAGGDGHPEDGYLPSGSLVSDGSALFGMAQYGGYHDKGIAFSLALPPNYLNLTAGTPSVTANGTMTLRWQCDFSRWDYRDKPVDVFLAAVKSPRAVTRASGLDDARAGERIYYFGPGFVASPSLNGPAYRGVVFPAAPVSGVLPFAIPDDASFAGEWKFAAVFFYSGGSTVRPDGFPAENSNPFFIR